MEKLKSILTIWLDLDAMVPYYKQMHKIIKLTRNGYKY